MGWYIRKSINIGPLRFNLSKSGIGTSVGTKGFRIGKKPNGKQFVHAGRSGLYFRKDLNTNELLNNNSSKSNPQLYTKSKNGSGCLSILVCLVFLVVVFAFISIGFLSRQ